MQEIPGFRRVGDPGLEPGTSSLSGKPLVPSSPPNSKIIPANRRDGAGGRGLERTGGDNLVAPSWPHGASSRAGRRVGRKRTSRRRYGQARTLERRAAARLHDRVDPPRASARRRARPSRARRSPASAGGPWPSCHATFSPAPATPPRPPRLPSYCNAGGAAKKPAPPVSWWQASRRRHCERSGASGRHGRLWSSPADRAQDRLHIDPGVRRRVRRRHQRCSPLDINGVYGPEPALVQSAIGHRSRIGGALALRQMLDAGLDATDRATCVCETRGEGCRVLTTGMVCRVLQALRQSHGCRVPI